MRTIHFGCQIVETKNRPLPRDIRKQARLSHHACKRAQFFLPTGKVLTPQRSVKSDRPICAVRTSSGVTSRDVSTAPLRKDHLKWTLLIETRQEPDVCLTQLWKQTIQQIQDERTQPIDVTSSSIAERFGGHRQFEIPDVQLPGIGKSTKQRIALFQRALIAAPVTQKVVFHVEHTPIEEASSLLPGTRNQIVRPRLETQDGCVTHQNRSGNDVAIEPCFQSIAESSNADSLRNRRSATQFPKDRIAWASVPRQCLT
ncbi:MAG: hypothetical protein ABIR62_12555 [Dokdonella sp.]|uniref:hypothetical protein n=1 Tax=Dokdonella sp. TaxID=2291710 RepID=UPI003266F6C8